TRRSTPPSTRRWSRGSSSERRPAPRGRRERVDGFVPELGVDLRAYAVGVRSFLTSTAALEEWRSVDYDTTADRIRHEAGLMGVLHDAGWSRWGWPESVGGLGGGLVHRATLY